MMVGGLLPLCVLELLALFDFCVDAAAVFLMCSRLSPGLGWASRWLSMEVLVLWAGWADMRRLVFSAMLFISEEMVMLL